jgi:putative iron-regulated protein
MLRSFGSLAAALCLVSSLAACGDDTGGTGTGGAGGGGTGTGGGGGTGPTTEEITPVVTAYADNVHEQYVASIALAEDLQAAIATFVGDPSEDNLEAAKSAWTAARPTYIQTEVFRFYDGPIDNEADGVEGRINGWPLDEGYIDYVEGLPSAGIINDPEAYPTIDVQLLIDRNEIGGEKNLSAGWHAIEFLLWGQDFNDDGPGDRPFTDFLDDEDEESTAANGERRRQYLQAAADLLIADLDFVEAQWVAGSGGYYDTFVTEGAEALKKILTGVGSMAGGELKSERINNAFSERDQEEEHSCFSDTTVQDHIADIQGIANVYTGDWAGASAKAGLDDLVAKVSPELDAKMTADLAAAVAAVSAIPDPFDQAIQDDADGRPKIQAAMDALQKVTDTTVEVATALNITLNLE